MNYYLKGNNLCKVSIILRSYKYIFKKCSVATFGKKTFKNIKLFSIVFKTVSLLICSEDTFKSELYDT